MDGCQELFSAEMDGVTWWNAGGLDPHIFLSRPYQQFSVFAFSTLFQTMHFET